MAVLTVRPHVASIAVLSAAFAVLAVSSARADNFSLVSSDFPGSVNTWAYGINDTGVIVGQYQDASGNYHGYANNGGTFTTIDVPGASLTKGTIAYGVSNSGTIVGSYFDTSNVLHGFVDISGTITTYDPPGSVKTNVYGVSNTGVLVGNYYTASSQFGFTYDLGGSTFTPFANFTNAINDVGDTAGATATGAHGFLQTNLFTQLDAPGGTFGTMANGLNNSDTVVGVYWYDAFGDSRGFVWQNGTYLDLPTSMIWAADINDNNQIAGTILGPDGHFHAGVATDVPEPAALAVLGVGLAGLVVVRRRRV